MKTRIIQRDLNINPEVEIDKDYLDKKNLEQVESRIKYTSSKLFEKLEDFGKQDIKFLKEL